MKNGRFIVISVMIFLGSCSLDIDIAGFFSSESTPDERFDMRESLPFHSETYRQNPAVLNDAGGNYTFAVISDVHVKGFDDTGLFNVIQMEIAEPSGNSDLFILDCGDSTQNGDYRQFQQYKDSMDSSGRPWFQSIGNHDLYFEGWNEYRNILGRTVYSATVGPRGAPGSLLLICLDSGNSTLGSQQMNWLEEILENEAGNQDHIIVFTHSNFFSTGLNTVVQLSSPQEIYKLMSLFTKYNVEIVFTGHNHHWDEREINGVEYIILEPLVNSTTSYVRVSVDGTNLDYQRIPINR